jgi:hypothetical protein
LVVAPIGLNSLVYFSLLTSWDSSISRRMWAVLPTTLADSSAERKTARGRCRADDVASSASQMPAKPGVVEAVF